MDSKFIGNITELEVLTYITKLGYQVSIPFGDRERYDQIWDINGKLLKVQVKTSRSVDNAIKFSCRSSHRKEGKCINSKYTSDEIDCFATFWDGKCYLVPITETSNEKTLRFAPPKMDKLKVFHLQKIMKLRRCLVGCENIFETIMTSKVRILLFPPNDGE